MRSRILGMLGISCALIYIPETFAMSSNYVNNVTVINGNVPNGYAAYAAMSDSKMATWMVSYTGASWSGYTSNFNISTNSSAVEFSVDVDNMVERLSATIDSNSCLHTPGIPNGTTVKTSEIGEPEVEIPTANNNSDATYTLNMIYDATNNIVACISYVCNGSNC